MKYTFKQFNAEYPDDANEIRAASPAPPPSPSATRTSRTIEKTLHERSPAVK